MRISVSPVGNILFATLAGAMAPALAWLLLSALNIVMAVAFGIIGVAILIACAVSGFKVSFAGVFVGGLLGWFLGFLILPLLAEYTNVLIESWQHGLTDNMLCFCIWCALSAGSISLLQNARRLIELFFNGVSSDPELASVKSSSAFDEGANGQEDASSAHAGQNASGAHSSSSHSSKESGAESKSQKDKKSSGSHSSADNGAKRENPADENDPYSIFGIPRDADYVTLRKAWKRALLRVHPDRSRDTDATRQAQCINSAYDAIRREKGWGKPPASV